MTLPISAPILNGTAARDVSGDGYVIVGEYDDGGITAGFKYDATGVIDIGNINPSTPTVSVRACSYNGGVIVGNAFDGANQVAFVYDSEMRELDPGFVSAVNDARAVSADGLIIGGTALITGMPAPVVWVDEIASVLGTLSSEETYVTGTADSIAGERGRACGSGGIGGTTAAVIWQPDSPTAVNIGVYPGDDTSSASAISRDGVYVVGYSGTAALGDYKAVLWDIENNTISNLGILPGYHISVATSISPDGVYVSGYCSNTVTFLNCAFLWSVADGMIDLGFLSGTNDSVVTGVANGGATLSGYNNTPSALLFGSLSTPFRPDYLPRFVSATISIPCYTACLGVGGIFTKV